MKHSIICLLAAVLLQCANAVFDPIRINCGSDISVTTTGQDGNDIVWNGDNYYSTSATSYKSSEGLLYGTHRFYKWNNPQPYTYAIPLPVTTSTQKLVTVNLYFYETFFTATSKRLFDVKIENNLVASNYDIVADVGTKSLSKISMTTLITDGIVNIEFIRKVQNPLITAIEIIDITPPPGPTSAPTIAPTNAPISSNTDESIRINCGSVIPYTDPNTNFVWEADEYYTPSATFIAPAWVTPENTNIMYETERYFNQWQHPQPFEYKIPFPKQGLVTINLLFVETYFTTPGSRVFDIYVQDQLHKENFDIIIESGGPKLPAIVSLEEIPIGNGFVTIRFESKIQNPKITGIEIIDLMVDLPPTAAPTTSAPTPAPLFDPLYINCGGTEYMSPYTGIKWDPDTPYVVGGATYGDGTNDILNTNDEPVYHTERNGMNFQYEIPVPVGVYDITLYFAELYWTLPNQRVFNIIVEDDVNFNNVDVVEMGGKKRLMATKLEVKGKIVQDGTLNIEFIGIEGKDQPKISGISIILEAPHYAHSVPDITGNLGYSAVDIDGNLSHAVAVDGSNSHTHALGKVLVDWIWRDEENNVIAEGEKVDLTLPVGTHEVSLEVIDDAGNKAIERTSVTIFEKGYPVIYTITPDEGSVAGNTVVTISGVSLLDVLSVKFGPTTVSGTDINIIDDETIEFLTPYSGVGVPVKVSVTNSFGVSNELTFTYVGQTPIAFTSNKLLDFAFPSVVAFGPDLKLYVSNSKGQIGKFTLNDDFTEVVDAVISSPLKGDRNILGLAFDPTDDSENPTVYCSSSDFYHGGYKDSFGDSINGKIHAISGANLDTVVDIITGLPVSDHDHGINGLEFGDNGELYFLSGSNTNGGEPGALSSTKLQEENYFSASAMVAHIFKPGFDGKITYKAEIGGDPITGHGENGVEVFASGLRNPYDIVLHPNGNLYATDNGPNPGFGEMLTGCGPDDKVPDQYGKDELNLIEQGKYYGHPNRKRGSTDPRQCVYKAYNEPSDEDYTAPLMPLDSSSDGITVFEANYFKGQMRGNLIVSQYGYALKRIILSADGKSVIPASVPEIVLGGDEGLDVTMAPNGYLIDARYPEGACYTYVPDEDASTEMEIMSVFPRRGAITGGNTLHIYGKNFSGAPTVTAGGKPCTSPVLVSVNHITCSLPFGSAEGLVDISVSASGETDTFIKGYKYINGKPAI